MRIINFVIFFGTFLLVYGAINFYIFMRGRQALAGYPTLTTIYVVVFFLFALSYLIGRVLERLWLSPLSDLFVWIGSFWLAMFIYFLLIVVVIDLARLVDHFLPFFHRLSADAEKLKRSAFIGSVALVLLIVAAGYVNACMVRVQRLDLTIRKKSPVPELKIALASDIHLGTIVGERRFCRIVHKINALQPDLILLAGDVVDEDLAPVIRQNLGEALRELHAVHGVYAITGNHEFIGGVEAAANYLQQHGVTVLRDRVVMAGDSLLIIGREDRSVFQFQGQPRKPLSELLKEVDRSRPLILMDHQPFGLHEAQEAGIDLQLSGHTHHGQLWPLSLITNAVYEKSWGYLKKGDTHFYISSGAGTWGPPIRIGNRPEVVLLTLHFNEP